LWGRKTYDQSVALTGGVDGGFGLRVKNYVFTHRPPDAVPPGVAFVNLPVAQFTKQLRAKPGKDIWMMGGGGLIGSFLDEGEIDEFIIHVVPVFIGEGMPLIHPGKRTVQLALVSLRRFADGVVRLHYRVLLGGQ
jgi:dihydrofolate reductase